MRPASQGLHLPYVRGASFAHPPRYLGRNAVPGNRMRPIVLLVCGLLSPLWLATGCAGDNAQASTAAVRRAPVAVAEPGLQPPPFDPGLERYEREQLPGAVQGLEGVERAAWASESTLVVHLEDSKAGDRAHLCPTVERYPALRATRLQLQPPPGSGGAVRFLQCRPY